MCSDHKADDPVTNGAPHLNSESDKGVSDIPRSVLRHVVDVHCHPTDSPISAPAIDGLPIRICAMSTRKHDQSLVAELADAHPDKVIPSFGYHPWFSHLISLQPVPETPEGKEAHYRSLLLTDGEKRANHLEAFAHIVPALPHPFPLSSILADLRHNISRFLHLHRADPIRRPKPMLGEVGLDRSFRIPFVAYDPSLREPPGADSAWPRLTPFHVPMEHQLAVLEAQISLAVELGLNVSLHSVKAQAQTQQLFARMRAKHGERFDAISVDMHSCGVSVETWLDIEKKHPNVFLSLSTAINGRTPLHRELICACSATRLLVESDFPELQHCTGRTWAMLKIVAEIKGWNVEGVDWIIGNDEQSAIRSEHDQGWGVVRRLEMNWKVFERAGHKRSPEKKSARQKKVKDEGEESGQN